MDVATMARMNSDAIRSPAGWLQMASTVAAANPNAIRPNRKGMRRQRGIVARDRQRSTAHAAAAAVKRASTAVA